MIQEDRHQAALSISVTPGLSGIPAEVLDSPCEPSLAMLRLSEGRHMLAAVGGLGIVGIIVVVLIVLAIVYFVRRA